MEGNPSGYFWQDNVILIGEDEIINFRLLEVMLAKTKVKLLHGRTGRETLQIFKDNPTIDLVLIDIKMPEMDGCEVTREIRKINQQVPIIAQTAFALELERIKALEAGCNAYLTKPIMQNKLLEMIGSFL